MNTLHNTVKLIGNLGTDPELIEFDKTKTLARFRVATDESYKSKEGEWVNKTTWHNIVAWGPNAVRCKEQLKKGSKIILNGKLRNDIYETKQGEKRSKTEVSLRQFMLLNREKNNEKAEAK